MFGIIRSFRATAVRMARKNAKAAGAFIAIALLFTGRMPAQCINLTSMGAPYTQNFDGLASTGTSSVVPPGWFFSESGTNANATYTAGNGASTAGDTYSFGATGSPERAFGMLQSGSLIPSVGACFINNTGATVGRVNISYHGEQWRLGTLNRSDRIDFQYSTTATSLTTGTWTDVDALDFSSPTTGPPTGALDGNAAANSRTVSGSFGGLKILNGTTFWIRWTDFNATGSDDGLAVDDFSLTPSEESGLSVGDVTVNEGDSGTTSVAVEVSLSAPAGPGGVTFDIATADGTATAPADYTAKSLTAQSIAEGQSSYSFTVLVNGDTVFEPNETFTVNVTNIAGANVVKASGTITILNDDVIPISQVQGSGNTSPYVGLPVAVRGIVTGVKSNGFFVQTPDAQVDGDPSTSEGIFVFSSGAPPAAAAVGNLVIVTGTVAEYAGDPNSPTATEITGPTVALVSSGNALPQPVTITAADTSPSGGIFQLERYEGMRVRIESLTVAAPTGGSLSEANATSTSNGVFYGVISGTARPFREPGIETPDPLPAGAPCCVPYWDANPERIRVDSGGQTGAAKIDVTTNAVVKNLVGVLDYGYRTYTIVPDPGTPPEVTGNVTAVAVPAPAADQFTVVSFNMARFYDTVNDPATSDAVLTAEAYARRLAKASQIIVNMLRLPDILAVQEMENLPTLQDVANKVNGDAIAAGLPNPNYAAYLIEGNDIGGIDVGFLVKLSRVSVSSVVQEGKDTTYATPAGTQEMLNDRPPLVLQASVQGPGGSQAFPLTVIANHLRSLSGIDDPTDGPRVRAKRRAQAEFLANLIQNRQANPAERIVVVGDFNAYPFSDGYVDVTGTVRGTPTPADNVVLASPDLVNPDLVDAADSLTPAERYSYVFDGSAQTLDQVLFTQNLQPYFVMLGHGRVNADFPEVYRSDATRPERLSDHDPAIAYFRFPKADLGLSLTAAPAPVTGQTVTYTLGVTNAMVDSASNVLLSATVPAGQATFQSITAPAGWTCTTPGAGKAGVVQCLNAALAPGSNAAIALSVTVECSVANGTLLALAASISSQTYDPDLTNNSQTSTTVVSNPPPVISGASADETELWPPNGKMVDVHISYGASDTCGSVSCVLTVTSNQPANTIGDGNRQPDFEVVSATLVRLRAERSAPEGDRVYTILITCTDSAGNSTVKALTVTVPKSQGKG